MRVTGWPIISHVSIPSGGTYSGPEGTLTISITRLSQGGYEVRGIGTGSFAPLCVGGFFDAPLPVKASIKVEPGAITSGKTFVVTITN